MVHRVTISNHSLLTVSGSLLITGFVFSILLTDFSWLARFGALLVGVGTLFFSRHVLVNSHYLISIEDEQEKIQNHVAKSHANRKAVSYYGPVITLSGTVIWAFGDLLNGFFGW